MEIRYAVALGLRNQRNEFIYGLRRPEKKEYPSRWSLPSTSISEDVFNQIKSRGRILQSEIGKLSKSKFGLEINVDIPVVNFGVRIRSSYILHMLIGLQYIDLVLPKNSPKYSKIGFYSTERLLKMANFEVGTCSSLLLQYLMNNNQIRQNTYYLELAPEIADSGRNVQDYPQEELWMLCSDNYSLLRTGETGGDGHIIRQATIDRYLQNFTESLPISETKLIDLGCGDNDLVERLQIQGVSAMGLDWYPDPLGKYKESGAKIHTGDIYKLDETYSSNSFNVAILNLVCQWVSDIDSLSKMISKILTKEGKALISIVPPEYSKNGHWNRQTKEPQWVIEKPVRRKPFLTMINRSVGPLWFYPYTVPDIICSFSKHGMNCYKAEYLFLDTYLSELEVQEVLKTRPYLERQLTLPAFTVLEFIKC